MRTERLPILRTAGLLAACIAMPVLAQNAGTTAAETRPEIPMAVIYGLIGLALVQVIFIMSLSSIMRTLGGTGGWLKNIGKGGSRTVMLLPLILFASLDADAQAYKGDGGTIPIYHLFWWLIGANVLLFALLIGQLTVLRGLTKALTGGDEKVGTEPVQTGPTWEQRLWASLSKRKPIEQEQDILMHHEYDGIRELDNVLPPWWLWLFYGTIAWGAVYLVNVHVANIWPKQHEEYDQEMAEAQADVDAFLAAQSNLVDERNVELLTDETSLASGSAVYKQNCATCHGQLGEGTAGPNLTDAYWLHGGGIQEVFTTIKYGVSGKAMKSWKTDLKPTEIQNVASYVLSLQGTNPPNPKAPEGDLWKSAAPSPADTSAVPADTSKLAQAM